MHDDLEQNSRLKRLLSKELNQTDYVDILQRYYSLFMSFENQTEKHAGWAAMKKQLQIRSKTELLEKDLRHFGVAASDYGHAGATSLRFLTENTAQLLGTAYVMEGSSLGGRYISRHLQERFKWTADSGACYFNGYAENTAQLWKHFCSFIENFSGPDGEKDQVVVSARHAFETFDCAMSLK